MSLLFILLYSRNMKISSYFLDNERIFQIMKEYLFSMLAITLMSCYQTDKPIQEEKPKALPPKAPTISLFEAVPTSVNEGDPVRIKLAGNDIERCDLLANGSEIALGLSLSDESLHTPTVDTDYEIICQGPGGEISAKTSVNIIIADDIVRADSLLEIGKHFDIDEIKSLALEGLEGAEFKDFEEKYEEGTISKSPNEALSISVSDAHIAREHSLLYGYDGNHDFDPYNKQCIAAFNDQHSPLYQKAKFATEIFAPTTIQKEFVIPHLYHIKDFEAITQSLESPIPQGTQWDVSFDLAQTKISYSENMTDYGEASGIFAVDGESISPLDVDETEKFSFRLSGFPDGYPVPPAANGYTYDPNHDTCSNPRPEISRRVIFQTEADLCNAARRSLYPGLADRFALKCEPGQGRGLPRNYPYSYPYAIVGAPISSYISPVGSNRIYRGNTVIECQKLFPTLAFQYGLGTNWAVQTVNNEVLFFNNSRGCSGFNCPGVEPRLSATDPSSWNVEPASNYCIDRWKGYDWNSYIAGIQATCQASQVYKDAVAKAQQQDNDEDMIQKCLANNDCKALVKSINEVLKNSYFLTSIEKKISSYEAAMKEAKEAGKSFLIPYTNPQTATLDSEHYFISRLSDFNGNLGLNSLITDMEEGYSSLVEIYEQTKGDWNTVLSKKEMVGKQMPQGFQSPNELSDTINRYKKALGLGEFEGTGLNQIAKPELAKLSCSWSAMGRFRKYSDLKINTVEISQVSSSRKDVKLRSITPYSE